MSKVTQLTDPVTKEKTYPVTTTDCVYLPNGESLTKHLNKSGLPLGLIISSAIVRNDAGLRLLDGSSLSLNGVYKAFCDYLVARYLEDNTSVPVCSIEEYANDMNKYGQCAKFVYNNTSSELISSLTATTYRVSPYSIKLPTITKHIEGISSISELGKALGAGLPNITGIAGNFGTTAYSVCEGAFVPSSVGTSATATTGASGSGNTRLGFDASESNDIYGSSDTVQTQSVKYPYYIVVATTTKTDIEVNIDNIASDLNNVLSQINERADRRLSNVTNLEIIPGYEVNGLDFVVENYISSDGLTWYRKWASGWKECGLIFITNTQGVKQLPVTFTQRPTCIATAGRYDEEALWGPGGNAGVVTINLTSPYDSAYIWCGTSSSGICCRLYCCGY